MARRNPTVTNPTPTATAPGVADVFALLAAQRAAERPVRTRKGTRYEKPMLPGNDPIQVLGGLFAVSVHVPFNYTDAKGETCKWNDPAACGGAYARMLDGRLDVAGFNVEAGPQYDPDDYSGVKFPRTYIPLPLVQCGLYAAEIAPAATMVLERVLKADAGSVAAVRNAAQGAGRKTTR